MLVKKHCSLRQLQLCACALGGEAGGLEGVGWVCMPPKGARSTHSTPALRLAQEQEVYRGDVRVYRCTGVYRVREV